MRWLFQPKSATEVSWQVHQNFEKKKKELIELKKKKIGHCDWVTEHLVLVVCIWMQLQEVLCCTYNMIFIT
jgi:hypothetical protein